jgi:hypothetical protein
MQENISLCYEGSIFSISGVRQTWVMLLCIYSCKSPAPAPTPTFLYFCLRLIMPHSASPPPPPSFKHTPLPPRNEDVTSFWLERDMRRWMHFRLIDLAGWYIIDTHFTLQAAASIFSSFSPPPPAAHSPYAYTFENDITIAIIAIRLRADAASFYNFLLIRAISLEY